MKTLRRLSAFVLLAAVAAGCSDSTAPEDITVANLVGTWNATSATFTPVGGGVGVEVVARGFDLTITIAASGAYTLTVSVPGEENEIETGTLTVSNGRITATPSDPLEDPGFLDIVSLNGDNLTLFVDDEEFDFTDDSIDNETAATLTIVLMRE
jgi:hypothetical protein